MEYVSILGIILKPYFTWILVEQPPRFIDGRHLNCSWVHHLCHVMPNRESIKLASDNQYYIKSSIYYINYINIKMFQQF